MFTLITSLGSPYGRKVRLVVACLGIDDKMQLQHADTLDENDPLRRINPLGKIPVLVPEGGTPIYDSRVIIDYLETTYGTGEIIPRDPAQRFRALSLAALAEGINDALLAITYESRFHDPEDIGPRWLAHQRGKLQLSLPVVIENLAEFKGTGIAATTLASALGYADWRKQIDWRPDYPELVDWLANYATLVPAWELTHPPES